jgi:hypothetical protein
MLDYEPLNDAIIATFGEVQVQGAPAIFHVPTGDIMLDVVLEENVQSENMAHSAFRDLSHTLMLPTRMLLNTGIALRQLVTVRAKQYSLLAQQPDVDGMTTFGVRTYQRP